MADHTPFKTGAHSATRVSACPSFRVNQFAVYLFDEIFPLKLVPNPVEPLEFTIRASREIS